MIDLPPPFDEIWFRFLFGFIIGACLGSFATMLAYRLPRHLSIVTPHSHCPSCKKILGIRDLVPIFSYLFSKGHCRYCHIKIGIKYLLIELAVSLTCALATVFIGFAPPLIIAYLAIIAAVVALSWKA